MRSVNAFTAVAMAVSSSAAVAAAAIPQTDPVIVTATRFPEPPQQLPVGVTVITAEQIERSTASTVPELLRTQAGIRTRDLSGSPNQQVDIRGFGIFSDQNTLVLLDGQRISENEQTPVNWSAIPLSAIERIEILRGSGAVLYGGGATGGTINIITKTPRRGERSGSMFGGAGSYNTREVRGAVSIAGDRLGMRANATHQESDGYRDNNRFRLDTGQADLRWTDDRATLYLKFGADDQRQGLPGAISEAQIAANPRQAATPRDFATLRSTHVNIGGETRVGSAEFAANLGYRERDTDASFFVGTPFRNNVETRVNVWSFTPRVRVPYHLGGWQHRLVAGVDYDDWSFDSSAQPSVVGRPQAAQRNTALYAQQTTVFSSDTTLVLGARMHRVSYSVNDLANPAANDGRKRNLSAYEIALRQKVLDPLAVYGKIGRSFRVPNVNDIYSLFTASVTPLEPQTSNDRELGLELSAGVGRYRLALYHMDLDNEIFFDSITFSNRNLPPTRRHGVETEASWRVSETLQLFANHSYSVSEFRSGSFGGISIAGNAVPLVPRHAVNAGIGWEMAPRTRMDLYVRHVGKQTFDADETNTFGRRMPAYTVVDLRMGYAVHDWKLSAGARNLLNEKYFSYGVFTGFPTYAALPAPERTFFVSAEYTYR